MVVDKFEKTDDGAVINKDANSYEEYKMKREAALQKKEFLSMMEKMVTDCNLLKSDIAEMKQILQEIKLNQENGNGK